MIILNQDELEFMDELKDVDLDGLLAVDQTLRELEEKHVVK